MADANSNSLESVADMGADGAKAVVPRNAAAGLDAYLAGSEVDLVMDDDQVPRSDPVV